MEILTSKVYLDEGATVALHDFKDELTVSYFMLDGVVNIVSVKLKSGMEFIHFLLQDELRYIKEQCKKIYLASKL